MKIGACVVLYNPEECVVNNIMSYAILFEETIVVDNSEVINEYVVDKIKKIKGVTYIGLENNCGIAKALNVGIKLLCQKKYDYVLTMDQDSVFPTNEYNDILKCIKKYDKEYSIIGLNFNYTNLEKSNDICVVPCWLTSGNFVNIKDYEMIHGFNEDLFIDYVDIEFGYKLYKVNKKICYLKNYSLKHQIGNPIEINMFFRKYYSMNHSPLRYYYRYRNSFYLYKVNKSFFKKFFYKEIFINIPKMLIFEKQKIKKLKMITKGIHDAKEGVLGKLIEGVYGKNKENH